ncbi:ribonuclease J [Rhizobiales bacterium]|uniref:ribonuclease J n=1 Tax=Hongsoonwoonella zoysiae TaxID=2821844 RepID=UPI00155F764E|nr:ribonuclease J [Hongsoonwoonella zoysiae]NRG18685.1 ribonuclease J [Hongsoonwoonella zoysiae]
MSSDSELVFVALGGLGEIGMNLGVYGYGSEDDRRWLVVDCGVSFAGPDLPGIDLVMPDIRFLEEERDRIDGIVITHAHEDHYGALIHLWPKLRAPLYMTAFTAGLLEAKKESEYGIEHIPVTVVKQGERLEIGAFDVEVIAMSHSIPEPCALAIRTGLGTVVHSGDWKIDPEPGVGKPIDLERLAEIGREGVRALICDSTNAVRDGVSPSEADVARELAKIIANASNRVVVTTFASNVARIRSIALAAKAAGREVVVMGRSMQRVIEVASELGYLDGLPPFLDEEAFGYLPRDKVVALLTGSQGEARAAMARVAQGDHRNVALAKKDLVIFSSRTIPGNEKAVNAIINQLVEQGIDVMTDRDGLVHVSGHPRKGELERLYDVLKPQALVPAHGEAMHLAAQEAFAREQGIKETVIARNGDLVRLAPGKLELIDEVPVGIAVKDGAILGDPEETGVRERRKLSFAGAVVVTLTIDGKGMLVGEPEAVLFGLPEADNKGRDFEDIVLDAVIGAVESIPKVRRKDPDLVAEAARRAARSAVNEAWGKKPLTRAIATRV